MKQLDARGLSCPEPVIMVRKAIESGETACQILLDSPTAKENVTRYAEHQGCRVECREAAGEYELSITK